MGGFGLNSITVWNTVPTYVVLKKNDVTTKLRMPFTGTFLVYIRGEFTLTHAMFGILSQNRIKLYQTKLKAD